MEKDFETFKGPFSVPTCQYYKRALAVEEQVINEQSLMSENNKVQEA